MAVRESASGFKRFYYALEDRYYGFLDRVDEHIPIYKAIDPIDRAFPSFILVLFIVVLLIIGLFFWLGGGFGDFLTPGSTLATIKLADNQGNILSDVPVHFLVEGTDSSITETTDDRGLARIDLGKEQSQVHLTIDKTGFESFEESVLLHAAQIKLITLNSIEGPAQFGGTFVIYIKNQSTSLLVNNQIVTVSYRCQDSSQAPYTQTTSSGQVSVDKEAECGTLYASVSTQHSYLAVSNVPVLTSPQNIFLEPTIASPTGFLDVTVIDGASQPVQGATVTISTSTEPSVQQSPTNSMGKTSFELEPGSYEVTAFVQADGRTATSTADVQADDTTSITLNIGSTSGDKKIFLKIIDADSQQPITSVKAKIYKEDVFLNQKFSDANGIIEQVVVSDGNKVFSAVLSKSGYLLKLLPDITLKETSDSTPQIVELEHTTTNPKNYGEALAIVSSETEPLVEDAHVYLYRTDYPNPLLGPFLSNDQGEALFSGIPDVNTADGNAAQYFVFAIKSEGTSETKPIHAGERVEFPVTLILDTGNFKVFIKDLESHDAISNASVRVFVLIDSGEQTLQTGQTSSSGEFETQEISIDQSVFFEISATDYLTHSTTGFTPIAGQTTELPPIFLASKDIVEPGEIFLAFNQLLDEDGTPAQIMEADKRYWAVFSMGLPEDIVYQDPIAHAEAGKRDLLLVDENPLAIMNAIAFPENLDSIIFSQALDPSNPFSNPNPIVGSEAPSKQVNIAWTELEQGTFEVRIAFDTNENAIAGTEIFLYYQSKVTAPSEVLSELLFERFVIGESVCQFDCDAIVWRHYYSLSGQDDFQEVTENPRVQLSQNNQYDIQYVLYNLTETLFTAASLLYESDPNEITLVSGNGFSNQIIPPGRFAYGETNPMVLETLESSPGTEIKGTLSTTPIIEDGSNETSLHFEIIGDQELDITHSFDPTTLDLTITISDHLESSPLTGSEHGGQVTIQKSCADLEEFVFDVTDSSYSQQATNENGQAVFDVYSLEPNECAIVEAIAWNYFPKRIQILGTSIPNLYPDFECIQIDANPSTPEIDLLFDHAIRGQTHDIKIISNDCADADVSIHTLDTPLLGNLISTEEINFSGTGFDPRNFLLSTNQSKIVHVEIAENAPLGFVPIIAYVTTPGTPFGTNYAAFIELIVQPRVSPNDDGFGIVEEFP
ncbi:carboxypeptidase-like regulatory domain-containing protein [Candidatus Micrarchaeota archaeon]|nr:carboxypeptidase-like regulatory domain-containing protein [Candidatus Micrarchaeota archaeon]MBU1930069.1 carboxypeptidase-like regulatory domain-containing protein [Candidatus Micrarchaeota archaeon]